LSKNNGKELKIILKLREELKKVKSWKNVPKLLKYRNKLKLIKKFFKLLKRKRKI
jgi:hypothetical protein